MCTHIAEQRHYHLFASAQCLGYSFEYGELTDELCAPSKETILKQVKQAVEKIGAVAVFVAADRDAMIAEFDTILKGKVRLQAFLSCMQAAFFMLNRVQLYQKIAHGWKC